HGAGEHQQQDQDLPFTPGRPGRRRERREQDHVEFPPRAPPVMGVEVVRQLGGQHDDPAGQNHAGGRRDEQDQAPLTAQRGVIQVRVGRVLLAWRWLVEFGQEPGQLSPFGWAHPPQLGLVYHDLIVPRLPASYLGTACALRAGWVSARPGQEPARTSVSWEKCVSLSTSTSVLSRSAT